MRLGLSGDDLLAAPHLSEDAFNKIPKQAAALYAAVVNDQSIDVASAATDIVVDLAGRDIVITLIKANQNVGAVSVSLSDTISDIRAIRNGGTPLVEHADNKARLDGLIAFLASNRGKGISKQYKTLLIERSIATTRPRNEIIDYTPNEQLTIKDFIVFCDSERLQFGYPSFKENTKAGLSSLRILADMVNWFLNSGDRAPSSIYDVAKQWSTDCSFSDGVEALRKMVQFCYDQVMDPDSGLGGSTFRTLFRAFNKENRLCGLDLADVMRLWGRASLRATGELARLEGLISDYLRPSGQGVPIGGASRLLPSYVKGVTVSKDGFTIVGIDNVEHPVSAGGYDSLCEAVGGLQITFEHMTAGRYTKGFCQDPEGGLLRCKIVSSKLGTFQCYLNPDTENPRYTIGEFLWHVSKNEGTTETIPTCWDEVSCWPNSMLCRVASGAVDPTTGLLDKSLEQTNAVLIESIAPRHVMSKFMLLLYQLRTGIRCVLLINRRSFGKHCLRLLLLTGQGPVMPSWTFSKATSGAKVLSPRLEYVILTKTDVVTGEVLVQMYHLETKSDITEQYSQTLSAIQLRPSVCRSEEWRRVLFHL